MFSHYFAKIADKNHAMPQRRYCPPGDTMTDHEVLRWIRITVRLVDPIAEDSWAERLGGFMPTYQARIRREQEEQEAQERKEQEEAERIRQEEAERIRLEQVERLRLEQVERHRQSREASRRKPAKVDREKQQPQQISRQRSRQQREQESGHLSPSSGRAVVKRKSASSVGASKSEGEVEEIMSPGASLIKSVKEQKGKGKEPEVSSELRIPRLRPKDAVPLSVSFCENLFCYFADLLLKRPPIHVRGVRLNSNVPSDVTAFQERIVASNARTKRKVAFPWAARRVCKLQSQSRPGLLSRDLAYPPPVLLLRDNATFLDKLPTLGAVQLSSYPSHP